MWSNNNSTLENDESNNSFSAAKSAMTENEITSDLKRGQNCVPVMIGHINRHEDLCIWGMPVRIITIVAIVTKVETVSTKAKFLFQDETGIIIGIKWLESKMAVYHSPVAVNSYARIHGNIRSQNNERFIMIMNIQPLEHLNELLAHLMEVTLICLENEQLVKETAYTDHTSMNSIEKNISLISGLNREQTIVFEIIKDGSSCEFGAERSEVKQKLPAYLKPRLNTILEFLSSEGHVYTTCTDDYFKVI